MTATPPEPGTPAPAADPAAPSSDPEASRIKSLDDRFNKIETEQTRQGTVLDQILTKIGAAPSGTGPVNPASTEPRLPADIGEQMRQAIRDVGAERENAAVKPEAHPEHPPRERRTPMRARLQRAVFGIDDKTPPGARK